MTERDLNQLFFLNRECEYLQRELHELRLRTGYRSPLYSHMPRGGIRTDFTDNIAAITDLEKILAENLQKIQEERLRLEEFIGGVADSETRNILRLKHINGLSYRQIGDELFMSYMTVQRKYKNFLEDVTKVTP